LKEPIDAHHACNARDAEFVQREPICHHEALIYSVQARVPHGVHPQSVICTADNPVEDQRNRVPRFCGERVEKVYELVQPNRMNPIGAEPHLNEGRAINSSTICIVHPSKMLSVGVAIISSVFSFLFVRHLSLLYAFNASFYLLLIEICKMLLCLICMNCIKRHKMQIRWGFLVNALLYALVNTLAFYIPNIIEPAIYAVLIQHKMLWVIVFSSLILQRQFKPVQYVALFAVCWGCMFVKMSDTGGDISAGAVLMIITQGICSSLSSIWIEKMMKTEQRAIVSSDQTKQQLYWFLADSLQMYMLGIPIYAAGAYLNPLPVSLPFPYALALVVAGAIQGLSLGAVFVYYNSVVRSIISAVVIVVLAVLHGVFSTQIVLGIAFVIIGVVAYVVV
jgi:drug/metabolite transporter (DMT)-like permease